MKRLKHMLSQALVLSAGGGLMGMAIAIGTTQAQTLSFTSSALYSSAPTSVQTAPRFTAEQMQYFLDVALGSEFATNTAKTQSKIHKWRDDVRIQYTGNPTAEDLKTLNAVIDDVNELTQNQLRFLRVRHTDFIFAVISEEFGFVGGVSVIVLIGIVIMRILRGARLAVDPLGSMICYGVAAIIFFQTVVSIGMNLELLPVTGLPLPFVSSGGTALLSTLLGIGLAQSVIVRRRRF